MKSEWAWLLLGLALWSVPWAECRAEGGVVPSKCSTKGASGPRCERCDLPYVTSPPAAPRNATCYYPLDFNLIYTMRLEPDEHASRLNFLARPPSGDGDVELRMDCGGGRGLVDLSVSSATGLRQLLDAAPCESIRESFHSDQVQPNATLFVHLRDFAPPIILQISFAKMSAIEN